MRFNASSTQSGRTHFAIKTKQKSVFYPAPTVVTIRISGRKPRPEPLSPQHPFDRNRIALHPSPALPKEHGPSVRSKSQPVSLLPRSPRPQPFQPRTSTFLSPMMEKSVPGENLPPFPPPLGSPPSFDRAYLTLLPRTTPKAWESCQTSKPPYPPTTVRYAFVF